MKHTLAARPAAAAGLDLEPEGGDPPDLCTVGEAAALLGVSRVSVWRWARDGRLPVRRFSQRTTRIRREDVERLLGDGREAGRPSPHSTERRAPCASWREMGAADHFVQFYDDDAFLVAAVAEFVGESCRVEGTGTGIVVATAAHRAAIERRLVEAGIDLQAVRTQGRFIALDAGETLDQFMVDGAPDGARFAEVIGGLVEQAKGSGPLRIFGEMVALLTAGGNHAGALSLEGFWNRLSETQSFALFCAYPMHRLAGNAAGELLEQVCGAHAGVIPAESYTSLPSTGDRLKQITLLQQKARSLEAALAAERAAREEAETALRLRDEFLAVAAHELRTPLTSISGQVQLALRRLLREDEIVPERIAQLLGQTKGQVDRLSRLLSQLLDVSRLRTGQLVLERRATDMVALVTAVVDAARPLSSRHTITATLPAALELDVDPLRFEQLLTNLLDNAIKYSPDGGSIVVTLTMSGNAAELSVRDHGLGIPADKREQIFERFYQAHTAVPRRGLGLGLYICRQIVEQHGGTLTVDCPDDGGSCFTVLLQQRSD